MSYIEQLQKDWDAQYKNCFFSKEVIERLILLSSSRFSVGQKVYYIGYEEDIYEVVGLIVNKKKQIIVAIESVDCDIIYTVNQDEIQHVK